MTADTDLPVWSIKPNWANGITERLSWLTDVLASTYGTVQCRALRLSPRREFEMTFHPIDAVRSYFDLWLHRMGSFEFMAPLFHDAGRLTSAIAGGATAIPFDTTYREFNEGDLAILIGDDPFTFDKVSITAVAVDGITVTVGGVTRAWPKGTRIHPLRRARLSDESRASAITNRVGEATLQFQLNQSNDIPDEGEWDTLYLGYPVIGTAPNRRENLDLDFNRNSQVLDNDLGLRVLNDDAGRAFTVQVDNRMMRGRAEHWTFRQMLYRLRGQQSPVWLPTFNRDIELSRAALSADTNVKIKKIGYAYTGGVIDGRQHLFLPGGLTAKVDTVGAPPSLTEERLNLSAALGANLPAGTFGSFMDTSRLASDDIEIVHHTDTDGVAECNLGFRSFRDPRIVPDIIYYPIPVGEASPSRCGDPAPEEASCVDLPTGSFATLIIDYSAGALEGPPPYNHYFYRSPWTWSVEFWRGATHLFTIDNPGSPFPFQTRNPALETGGFEPNSEPCLNVTYNFYAVGSVPGGGGGGWASDPFADGLPDSLIVNVGWPYSDWSLPTGSGGVKISFQHFLSESPQITEFIPVSSGFLPGLSGTYAI